MPKLTRFLVVRADGACRVTKTKPNLALDEFAYRLQVTVPDAWSRVIGDIALTLPDPATLPAAEVQVVELDPLPDAPCTCGHPYRIHRGDFCLPDGNDGCDCGGYHPVPLGGS